MKLVYWKLTLTAGKGNTLNGCIWHVTQCDQQGQFGYYCHLNSPLSAMRLENQREDILANLFYRWHLEVSKRVFYGIDVFKLFLRIGVRRFGV
jgi:hypothetical protein